MAAYVVIGMAVAEGILVGTVLVLIKNVWGYAYSNVEEVVKHIAIMMPIIACSNFLDGLQCVLSGSFSFQLCRCASYVNSNTRLRSGINGARSQAIRQNTAPQSDLRQ